MFNKFSSESLMGHWSLFSYHHLTLFHTPQFWICFCVNDCSESDESYSTDSSSKDLHEPGTFNRDRRINTQAPILSSILQSYRSTVISVTSIHHTALVLSIGNLTMQPGRELTPPASEPDATPKAKEDEDYYLDLVTFEVKGKKPRAVLKKI